MNWVHGTLAAFAGLLGVFVALHHPLWPVSLTAAFCAWCVAVYARPAIWLFVVPALLPVAGFSAWTGWIGVEEFDLLVLGAAAGCYARMVAGQGSGRFPKPSHVPHAPGSGVSGTLPGTRVGHLPKLSGDCPGVGPNDASGNDDLFRSARICLSVLALSYMLALVRGLADAGDFRLDWFQGYEEPLNSLRVGKSFGLVLLLLPSLRNLLQSASFLAERHLAAGIATGLGVVGLAIVCERAGYPGLLDFSTPYRSTALFWEMHVGGAALDGFLVLALPFAAYSVINARTPGYWALAASLAVVTGYACLTTFSRGVYLGAVVSLIVAASRFLASHGLRGDPPAGAVPAHSIAAGAREPWRVWGNRVLVGVLILEIIAVLGLGDFMSTRLSSSERDLGGRLQHWREGLSLLRQPSELLLGRGLGRFPANYSQAVPERDMPARLRIIDAGEERHLRISGPRHCTRACRGFDLLQRLPALLDGSYTVTMDLRAPQGARLRVASCHKHLLYAASCSQKTLVVPAGDESWQSFSLSLTARGGHPVGRQMRGPGFLVLRFEEPADFTDIDNLSVRDEHGRELLHNGTFSGGMAHWFFAGRQYFLPWHVDSLFLEVLIDQGAIGLFLLLTLVTVAFGNLLRGPGRKHTLAPYLLAALAGCLAVGVFSSLLDMPRSAFLFFLLLCGALFLDGGGAGGLAEAPSTPPGNALKALVHCIIRA